MQPLQQSLLVAALSLLLPLTVVAQQSRTTPVATNPQQARSDVRLDLELGKRTDERALAFSNSDSTARSSLTAPTLRVGDELRVCFQATRAGYVTIWNRVNGASPSLIYPNSLSQSGAQARAEQVTAGEKVCIGDDNRFGLKLGALTGEADVYLFWTPTEDKQLRSEDYPVIGGTTRSARTLPVDDYASTAVIYRVE